LNALSIAICGNEKKSSELHVKCAIELILHKNYYTKYEEKSLNLKSSSYKEACEEALKRYALSSVGLMHAAASGFIVIFSHIILQ